MIGSSLLISLLDQDGSATGQSVSTQTSDDLGAFSVEVPAPGLVTIEAEGYYFNEVLGDLSGSSLTLRAYADLDQVSGSVYVNILTHLTYLRVAALLEAGATLLDATEQAETELRTALAIGPTGLDPNAAANTISLLAGDDLPNAYLLAVGAVILEAARTEAGPGGPVDGTFQQILNTAAADFSAAGELPDATKALLDAAELSVDGDGVMANLAARFSELGSNAVAPNIHRALDPDKDDLASADDNCPYVANPAQEDADADDVGDACECGNGVVDFGEVCDDGNVADTDGCEHDCRLTCQLLGDIAGTGSPIEFHSFTQIGTKAVFLTLNAGDGALYATDLVSGGAELLHGGPFFDPIIELGGQLYLNGPTGLWRTDGTVAGTVSASMPTSLLVGKLNGQLLLDANGDLAISDGTPANTTTLGTAAPVRPLTLGSSAVFSNFEAASGGELWATDGTAAGTLLLRTYPTAGAYDFSTLGVINGIGLFGFEPDAMWRSDGTAVGTFSILSLYPQTNLTYADMGGYRYFRAIGSGIHRTDGTLAGTQSVGFPSARILGAVNDLLVLYEDNGELSVTDGGAVGTPIATLPSFGGEVLSALAGDRVFFTNANEPALLWVTDGTAVGTHPVISDAIAPIEALGDWIYLMRLDASGQNPWRCRVQ